MPAGSDGEEVVIVVVANVVVAEAVGTLPQNKASSFTFSFSPSTPVPPFSSSPLSPVS